VEENQGFSSKDVARNGQKKSASNSVVLLLAVIFIGIYQGLVHGKGAIHLVSIVLAAFLVVFLIFAILFQIQPARTIRWIMGPIGHVQIFSPELERRIRERYQQQIRQLEFLGFNYLFSEGETFHLFRLLLVFPAMVTLTMRSKGEVMAIGNGPSLLTGHPIFASADKSAFGHSNGLGSKFHTVFHDGTILATKNYGDSTGYSAIAVVQSMCEGTPLSDMWAAHQTRVGEIKAEGKRVENPISFEAYAAVSHRETAINGCPCSVCAFSRRRR